MGFILILDSFNQIKSNNMAHVTAINNFYNVYGFNVDNYQDGITFWCINEKRWVGLDRYYQFNQMSEGTYPNGLNSIQSYNVDDYGWWFASADSIVISDSIPDGYAVGAIGSQWIYQENYLMNDYDSMITYTFNGERWVELHARMLIHNDTPSSVYKTPNSPREKFLDTSTGILYNAFNNGWVTDGGITG